MATLKEVQDGTAALIDHGFDPKSEIIFEHDIAYAGHGDDPNPELIEAMENAGWSYKDGCFTLGLA